MTSWEKINCIDRKAAEKEIAEVKALQEAGLYPNRFDMPLTVQFELTEKCNLKCRHCYNMSNEKVYERTMTTENWLNVVDNIIANGGIFQAIMSGGEPLLMGDGLFQIMDKLHDDGTSFVLISNGMLMTDEIVRKLKKYRFYWVQISIDGFTAEYHDWFRGVKGSWQKAVDAAFYVSKHGLPLKIAHCVTESNFDDLENMVEMAYHLGASEIILGENMASGRAAKNRDTLMPVESKNKLIDKIGELQDRYSGRMGIQRSMGMKMSVYKGINNVNSSIILRPNGDLRLDCVAPFVIGNLFEDELSNIWRKKGIGAWQNTRIQEFYEAIDEITNTNSLNTNYVDKEILI